MKRYELTKEHWEQVKAVLPLERTGKRGRPRKDERRMLNGMLWIAAAEHGGGNCRRRMAPGSPCMPDLLNGGTMVHWKPYFAHCPQGMTMNQSMPLNCWKR